jgi:hypothetical protein
MMNQLSIEAVGHVGSYAAAPGLCTGLFTPGNRTELGFVSPRADKAPRVRDERPQVQAEQWKRAVSGSSPIALTAHVAATTGGESGPYPWRQPV